MSSVPVVAVLSVEFTVALLSRDSGYYTGYWNEKAEKWFQERLNAIWNGQAEPMSASTWKKRLRIHTGSQTSQFMRAATAGAKDFISCNCDL